MAKQRLYSNYKRPNHETIIQGGLPEVEVQYVVPVDTSVTTLLQRSVQNFVPQYTGDTIIEVYDHMKIKAQRDALNVKIQELQQEEKNLNTQLKDLEVQKLAQELAKKEQPTNKD